MTEPENKIRILIADDHSLFRDSLKALLETEPGLHIAGEAGSGKEALEQVDQLKPDILLLDFSMPDGNGRDVLKALSESGSTVRTIVLSAVIDADGISEIFELGSRGLLMKDATSRILIESITSVMEGRYWIGVKSTKTPYRAGKKPPQAESSSRRSRNYDLTPREMDVIKTVVAGLKTREIAEKLSISEQTVKHHITSIFDKLGVSSRLELTLFAFHHKLIKS